MRILALGPVAVYPDGQELRFESAKQRLLLAILCSRQGYPVPLNTLIEALWPGRPPKSPEGSLRWHVHRLRKALGEADRVRWRESGYALHCEPGELDVLEFERIQHDGATLAATADHQAAGQKLGAALELWRGPAYGEFADVPVLRDETNRLEALRLVTLERRVTADIALGRHEDLTAELPTLIANHPYRERFRAQLMLVLYRCGRRVEALEVYRGTRRLFSGELGIEPSAELRELERDILTSAPRLAASAPSPARTASAPMPAELPLALAGFVGRTSEVKSLGRRLTALNGHSPAFVAISGMGGIGKSALAVQLAHRVAEQFPDGQLYVNLHGSTPDVPRLRPEEVLARFLRSLGHNPAGLGSTDELAGRFRSVTAGRRMLIVLDNAADDDQVRTLLPGSADCAVLATSRRPLTEFASTIHNHQLKPLTHDEAVGLLASQLGSERVDAEPEAVAAIARRCGCHPLALCLAAARLIHRRLGRLSTVADRLANPEHQLAELDFGDRGVRASFAVSYGLLDVDAASLFRLLSLHPGTDIGRDTAIALLDIETDRVEELLSTLVDAQLLDARPEPIPDARPDSALCARAR